MGRKIHVLTCERLHCSLLGRWVSALLYKGNSLLLQTKRAQLEAPMEAQESKAWHGGTWPQFATGFGMGGRRGSSSCLSSAAQLPNNLETVLGQVRPCLKHRQINTHAHACTHSLVHKVYLGIFMCMHLYTQTSKWQVNWANCCEMEKYKYLIKYIHTQGKL